MTYRELPGEPVDLEEEILATWEREDTFRRSLELRADAPPFVFFEGPPTANGRPGVHHVLSRTIKDTVVRHRAMRGHRVTRIAGWDTHGLPVELEAERQLGISGRPEIERIGIEEFNRVCRENLFTYKEEWERLSRRIAYWLDYEHPYITCSPEYVESVWWALAEIDRRGLLYRGHKSLPYCPRCGTGLSSHELAQGYAEREDPSLYVRFPLAGEPDRHLLVWTTTPWTLVSNVAVAFGPEIDYVEVEDEGGRAILSAARADALFEGERALRRVPAEELARLRYHRPLDLIPDYDRETGPVLAAPFVTDEDGTGLVHIAPGFGADDFELGLREGLETLRPVDDAGCFEPDVREVGGRFVQEADPVVIRLLADRGLLFRLETVRHAYPHCWRCESPLLYMARDSWYVRTTAVRDRLLAHNAAVDWHPPEIGRGRMGEWLEGNVDWAISRDRYWGTPLPIWVCDADSGHREVLGSYEALSARAGGLPEDFDPHRPGIDALTWPCDAPGCGGTRRRVPEVLDAWFDSGSMPWAQWHYPFENRERFEEHFPADFIAEGVDQTRGWFYSLLALSTALFDEPSYRAVVVNDLVLDADGQKMSKSRGNAVDPWESLAEHGADALRFYLLSVSHPWTPKRWDGDAIRETNRKLFDTLRSTYRFFALYAGLEGWSHADPGAAVPAERPVMDRWLLGRLDGLTTAVETDLETFDLTRAARRLARFVVDDLSNWYVRRSRERFWATRGVEEGDARNAFATLHEALVRTALLLAPFAPFLSDWLHRELAGTSAHLTDYPRPAGRYDAGLEREMEDVRSLATLGRAAREEAGVRVRQPLRSLQAMIPGRRVLSEPLAAVLREELNVKELVFPSGSEDIVRLSVRPDFGRLGPRFGPRTPRVARALSEAGEETARALRRGETVSLDLDDGPVQVGPEEVRILEEAVGELAVQAADGYLVALDATVDPELRAEGLAREVISRVQRLRRDSGLEVADRIRLGFEGTEAASRAVRRHAEWIAAETLAVDVAVGEGAAAEHEHERDEEFDEERGRIGISRATGRGR